MIKTKPLTIVFGHYGSGKTNFSINYALDLVNQGEKVTLVDMDIVNPYFRSSEYTKILEDKGIEVIAPQFAGSNLDTPSLSPKIYSVFVKTQRCVVFDVGGDDAGAFALGRFSKNIKEHGEYNAFYVVNKYRPFTSTPQKAAGILPEIEKACSLSATAVVNNSHLQGLTGEKDILAAVPYAKQVSTLLNLPLAFTTVPKKIWSESSSLQKSDFYPVDIIVRPPFDL